MRTVHFHADGLRLEGSLFLPADRPAAGAPAVVFCHGFGATREYVATDIAEALCARGIGVLTFDHRGFGASEGARFRMRPAEQVADIRAAVVLLSTLDGVDPSRLGLYGISFGGAHAIAAAAAEPLVRATVSCVPFADGATWMRSMRRYWEWCELLDEIERDRVTTVLTGNSAEVDPDRILVRDPESVEWNEWLKASFPSRASYTLPLETAGAIIDYAPIRVADRVSHLMVVAAGRDTLMPRTDAGDLIAAAREPKTLVTLPDATHHDIYRGRHFDEVADAAAGWLGTHLEAKERDS